LFDKVEDTDIAISDIKVLETHQKALHLSSKKLRSAQEQIRTQQ